MNAIANASGLEPVVKELVVPAKPDRAFDVFVEGIGKWWPRDHKLSDAALDTVVIEPREGGALYEVDADGVRCEWGHVIAFEPGKRLVLGWQLDAEWVFDAGFVTEVEVTFAAVDGGTLVRLEHRNLERYGENAAGVRQSISAPTGWPGILESYATLVVES